MPLSNISARNLLTRAARMINFLGSNQAFTSEEANDAFEVYREWMEGLNNQGLSSYATTRNEFTLSASTSSYTIGDGATFNVLRPDKILQAAWQSGGLEYPIQVVDTFEEWGRIPVKSTTSTLPQAVYLETDYDANGYATVLVYPVPTATVTLVLG